MTDYKYLANLKKRQRQQEVKSLTAFGMLIGSIVFLVSGWFYLFILWGHDFVYQTLMAIGAAMFLLGIFVPSLLRKPELFWMTGANILGKFILSIILTIVYLVAVLPVGIIYRRVLLNKNESPFLSWDNPDDLKFEGWVPKDTITLNSESRPGTIFYLISLFGFFFKNGKWVLIPVTGLLLMLGALFFFIQGSVLAPFIYTIF